MGASHQPRLIILITQPDQPTPNELLGTVGWLGPVRSLTQINSFGLIKLYAILDLSSQINLKKSFKLHE